MATRQIGESRRRRQLKPTQLGMLIVSDQRRSSKRADPIEGVMQRRTSFGAEVQHSQQAKVYRSNPDLLLELPHVLGQIRR